jgi:hypothetical protein
MALLRRASAAGHFRYAAKVARLRGDPDFSALRGRDDFRRWLAEVRAGAY